jgi:ubiquitin-activating enzyme E1
LIGVIGVITGHEAQKKLSESNVLIVGLKGLGVEIAKNVILAGVKSVGLLDNAPVAIADLGAQFYLKPTDVGRPRAECSLTQLTTLNRYVKTSVVTEELSIRTIESKQWQVVVLCDRPIKEQLAINAACHANGVKFIAADIRGLMASCFVDLGDTHTVSDVDGENPLRGLILDITRVCTPLPCYIRP